MSLLSEVALLKELEAKSTCAPWRLRHGTIDDWQITANSPDFYIGFVDSDKNDPEMITEIRNAAPALLEVLGGFQPGDAGSLDFVLDYLIDDPNDNRDPEIEMAKKVVRRLQAMAAKMEEPDAR